MTIKVFAYFIATVFDRTKANHSIEIFKWKIGSRKKIHITTQQQISNLFVVLLKLPFLLLILDGCDFNHFEWQAALYLFWRDSSLISFFFCFFTLISLSFSTIYSYAMGFEIKFTLFYLSNCCILDLFRVSLTV